MQKYDHDARNYLGYASVFPSVPKQFVWLSSTGVLVVYYSCKLHFDAPKFSFQVSLGKPPVNLNDGHHTPEIISEEAFFFAEAAQ